MKPYEQTGIVLRGCNFPSSSVLIFFVLEQAPISNGEAYLVCSKTRFTIWGLVLIYTEKFFII